jgi:hypothetical protein
MDYSFDLAWIATRQKALLTQADRDRLTMLRRQYAPSGSLITRGHDPHVLAVIDALLAP